MAAAIIGRSSRSLPELLMASDEDDWRRRAFSRSYSNPWQHLRPARIFAQSTKLIRAHNAEAEVIGPGGKVAANCQPKLSRTWHTARLYRSRLTTLAVHVKTGP